MSDDIDGTVIVEVSVHTVGRPLVAKVRDFSNFTTLEILVSGGPTRPDQKIAFFIGHHDDAQLEAVVNGILEARPELREKLVREDTGPEEAVGDGQA
jgi:hypothetical protein